MRPPPSPAPISPHNQSPPSCIWLKSLSSHACLSFNKSFLSRKGDGFYVRTCKSFLNMKSLKCSSWICSAWEVLPIPSLNRQNCSLAKWPPVCQKSDSPSRPGACDKCLHFNCQLNVVWKKCIFRRITRNTIYLIKTCEIHWFFKKMFINRLHSRF